MCKGCRWYLSSQGGKFGWHLWESREQSVLSILSRELYKYQIPNQTERLLRVVEEHHLLVQHENVSIAPAIK